MDKRKIIELIKGKIGEKIKKDEKTMAGLRQASIEAPSAMESHSDTNKFQFGTMADNLSNLINDQYKNILAISSLSQVAGEKVESGNVVEVKDEDSKMHFWYFILPAAGGIEIDCDEKKIIALTESAPLAKCLLGKLIGETAEFSLPNDSSVKKFVIINLT